MQTMPSCKLLSWNLLAMRGYAAGEDPERNPAPPRPWLAQAIAAALRASDADVIAIQEAPERESIDALAAELGFVYAWFPARWSGNAIWRGGFPGAILSRHAITGVVDGIAAAGSINAAVFQRHWGWCEILHPAGSIIVHTLHLCADWGGTDRSATRLDEIRLMQAALAPQLAAGKRVVVCGDCNSPAGNPARHALDALGGAAAISALGHPPTAPSIGPVVSIDEIWAFAPLRLGTGVVLDGPPFSVDPVTGVALSDHLPVMADLMWLS
jgi:endonuclease/exonuclease/phosphatase family metal-dependent hydrolase